MESKYESMDIARWFIRRNNSAKEYDGGDDISLLKLLKLLYYAEGCSLASDAGSLFPDPILAWEHGPVVEKVWKSFEDPYHLETKYEEDEKAFRKLKEDDKNLLENVFDVFGKYSAWGLRNKTHEEDPWRITTKNGTVFNGVIDRGLITKYFKENYIR